MKSFQEVKNCDEKKVIMECVLECVNVTLSDFGRFCTGRINSEQTFVSVEVMQKMIDDLNVLKSQTTVREDIAELNEEISAINIQKEKDLRDVCEIIFRDMKICYQNIITSIKSNSENHFGFAINDLQLKNYNLTSIIDNAQDVSNYKQVGVTLDSSKAVLSDQPLDLDEKKPMNCAIGRYCDTDYYDCGLFDWCDKDYGWGCSTKDEGCWLYDWRACKCNTEDN